MMKLKKLARWILVLGLASPLLAGAADAGAPFAQPVTQGDITFVSGGIGMDERQALDDVARDYNLKLVFAEKGSGAYMADVKLAIVNAKGRTILESVSDGPWFLVKLMPGRYKITAEAMGQSLTRHVRVGSRLTTRHLYWTPHDKTDAATPGNGGQ
jgi:predicted TIM-barrel fold metal-dependent hydrolase